MCVFTFFFLLRKYLFSGFKCQILFLAPSWRYLNGPRDHCGGWSDMPQEKLEFPFDNQRLGGIGSRRMGHIARMGQDFLFSPSFPVLLSLDTLGPLSLSSSTWLYTFLGNYRNPSLHVMFLLSQQQISVKTDRLSLSFFFLLQVKNWVNFSVG